MAIDSLFEDGVLADWREFSHALKHDEALARETLAVCGYHYNLESAALAKVLVSLFHDVDEDMGLR